MEFALWNVAGRLGFNGNDKDDRIGVCIILRNGEMRVIGFLWKM